MRRGYAECRSLEAAPGHRFRSDEDHICQAFLLQVLIHQWPALLAPDLGQYLIEIDEEAVYFYLPNSETAQHVSERMQRWKHSRKGN